MGSTVVVSFRCLSIFDSGLPFFSHFRAVNVKSIGSFSGFIRSCILFSFFRHLRCTVVEGLHA